MRRIDLPKNVAPPRGPIIRAADIERWSGLVRIEADLTAELKAKAAEQAAAAAEAEAAATARAYADGIEQFSAALEKMRIARDQSVQDTKAMLQTALKKFFGALPEAEFYHAALAVALPATAAGQEVTILAASRSIPSLQEALDRLNRSGRLPVAFRCDVDEGLERGGCRICADLDVIEIGVDVVTDGLLSALGVVAARPERADGK